MEEILLDIEERKDRGSRRAARLRAGGKIPAVLYGADQEPLPLSIDRAVYEKIRRTHHGELIIKLRRPDGNFELSLVKDEQLDPVTDELLHIDFQRISLTETIEVKVPVEPVGEPVGVKRDGGTLEHVIWELDVACLPEEIPEKIEVDVSHLEIGDAVHVRDLPLPTGIKVLVDEEAVVFTVAPPMKEEETELAPAEGEPEVIKEKKEKEKTEEEASGEDG